jgi:hypothetical protein
MTSKGLILAAAMAFSLVFVACSESVVSPNDEATTPLVKKVKPPPAGDPTPVTAEFADGPGDGILSDGSGSYDAVILVIGNLFLDARKDTPRQLCFDFASQAGAPVDHCDDAYLSTADPDIEGGLPAMNQGSTMTTRGQATWVGPDADGKVYNWFLYFGQDCDSNDVVANRFYVTLQEDTWTLAGTSAFLCRMPTKGRPLAELVGTFAMPFELTVTR